MLWAAWGLRKDCTGTMWALSPHISGIRIKLWCSWKGFIGNKQIRGPVHLNSPPWHPCPRCRTQPAFCVRCWSPQYCWLITGSKDTSIGEGGKVLLIVPGPPIFLIPSIDRAQRIMWFRIMPMTKNRDSFHSPGWYLCTGNGNPWAWF